MNESRRAARDLLNRIAAGDKTPTHADITQAIITTGDIDCLLAHKTLNTEPAIAPMAHADATTGCAVTSGLPSSLPA